MCRLWETLVSDSQRINGVSYQWHIHRPVSPHTGGAYETCHATEGLQCQAEWLPLTVRGAVEGRESVGGGTLEAVGGVGLSRRKQELGSTRSTREPSWWVR